MNAYERVMNRIAGKPVDHVPNLSLTMMFSAREAGVSFGEFCTDYRKLADGALRCHEKYGIDMVCAISDPMREAQGLGAKVIVPEDGVPFSPEPRIRDISQISGLKPADPMSSPRMYDRVQAVGYLKERVGMDVPVIGWIEGAIAESCDIMNMQEFFVNLLEEPEAMEEMMEICMEQSLWFAKAQIEAGADIIGMGDAASSLIGPSLYEEFALPFQQKMIRRIHDMGAKVKLHICGDLNPVLELVAQTGADIIDVDYMVDMERAAKLFPKGSCVCGNFNPVDVVYQGNRELIFSEVKRCLAAERWNPCMISPGCEIPKDTPPENVLAIHEAIVEGR